MSFFFWACYSCDGQLLSHNAIPIPYITNNSFVNLLTFHSPIDDSIMHHILHILYQTNSSFKFLDTNFSSSLIQKGWSHAYQKFFLHENTSRFAQSTKVKPTLSAEIILIPFFIHASHWVAIVRRLIDGKVHFFYSDDLNSTNTYESIRSLFTTSTPEIFHPHDSTWVKIHAFTYVPHSNECGPRALLALLTIATHPSPHENILLPFMHGNLAQICRWWLAKAILLQRLDTDIFHTLVLPNNRCVQNLCSKKLSHG